MLGKPLEFSRYEGMESDRLVLRAVTDEIMYAILAMSGQEYEDVYATTAKARLAPGSSSSPASLAVTFSSPASRSRTEATRNSSVPPRAGRANSPRLKS